MRKLLILMLFVSLHLISYNQTVKGVILDKNTHEKISFATVYFDGTFVGTISNIYGEFKLNIGYNTSMPLIVSSIGYYSVSIPNFSTDNPITIYLTPKDYNLNDITVSDVSLVKQRKANFKIFKKIFLGTTKNALSCEITNPQDIRFIYDSDKDTLKAFATKPIHITNYELGYKITCYIDKFEYYRKSQSFLFIGNNIFNEDLAIKTVNNQSYKTNRKKTYLGSRMHFFRALWADDLESSGFIITNSSDKNLKSQDIVIQEIGSLLDSKDHIKKYLKYPTKLSILYHSNSSEISLLKPKVYFDETGYFDLGINWYGEMVTHRTGDMLPYNYKLNE